MKYFALAVFVAGLGLSISTPNMAQTLYQISPEIKGGIGLNSEEKHGVYEYVSTLLLNRKSDLLGAYAVSLKEALDVSSLNTITPARLKEISSKQKFVSFTGKIDKVLPVKNVENQYVTLSYKVKGEEFPVLLFLPTQNEGYGQFSAGDSVDLICKHKKYAGVGYQFDCLPYRQLVKTLTKTISDGIINKVFLAEPSYLLEADLDAAAYGLNSFINKPVDIDCYAEPGNCLKRVTDFLKNPELLSAAKSELLKIGVKEFNKERKWETNIEFDLDKSKFPTNIELNEKQIALWASFTYEVLNNRSSKALEEQKITAVDPETLLKTYEQNEIEGDLKYLDKLLYISGKIDGIKSGIGNKPYIQLRTKNTFKSPQLTFVNPDMSRLAKLRKGQNINLVCKGSGEVIGTPTLKDCDFADDYFKNIAIIAAKGLNSKLKVTGKDLWKTDARMALYFEEMYPEDSPCFDIDQIDKCDAMAGMNNYNKKNNHLELIYFGESQLAFQGFNIYDPESKKDNEK